MKKLFIFLAAGALFSCNTRPGSDSSAAPALTASGGAAPTYAYSIEHPDNWEPGSTANTAALLTSLKAWEQDSLSQCLSYFGDSVRLQFDKMDRTLPNDSVKAMFADGWAHMKGVRIKMEDWSSVISKDKSQEWVTIWYKQYKEMKDGTQDSLEVINDAKFKGGKIIQLDEYGRKL